jgi:hypothetical protein
MVGKQNQALEKLRISIESLMGILDEVGFRITKFQEVQKWEIKNLKKKLDKK